MLNQLMRYLPILDYIKRGQYQRILEVGSGSSGIAKYFTKRLIVGCDISFADYGEVESPIHKNLIPIKASAECLPFKNCSFDIVISVDMLEHIELAVRENVIKELYRVAGEIVFLIFPCGEKALEYDRRLKTYYESKNRKVPKWLTEHLESEFPMGKDIISILDRNAFEYEVKNNENLVVHYLIMILESFPNLSRYLTIIANLIGQEEFGKGKCFLIVRIIKHILRPLRNLFKVLNFGVTYRKIFIIKKNSKLIDHKQRR
ncbi:hypothetical protein CVT91_07350 [Candidatus Atribacteria bacterium HGW-Atribacteria-1]|nr:MAG: hypothetical protein CVT91_07350 [Candidatus Atribacteria bacterium HGW-Atribacteria-1]